MTSLPSAPVTASLGRVLFSQAGQGFPVLVGASAQTSVLWVISVTLCQPAGGSAGSFLSPALQGVDGDWVVDGVWWQLAEPRRVPSSEAGCVYSRSHVLFPLPPLEGPGAPCDLSDPRVCAQAPPGHRAGHLVVLGVVPVAVSWPCRLWGASPGWFLLPCVLTALTLKPGWLMGAQDSHLQATPRREQPHSW